MSDRFYTGTFQITEHAGRQRGDETRVATLLFVNLHPVVYETCYPGMSTTPPVLLHHAEIEEAQAGGIMAMYKAMNRMSKAITLEVLHEELVEHADRAIARKDDVTVSYHVGKVQALEGYADAMGIDLASAAPKP
jgi:hypothetical protein